MLDKVTAKYTQLTKKEQREKSEAIALDPESRFWQGLYRQTIPSADEVIELMHRIKKGDRRARDRMILGNMPFVVYVARRHGLYRHMPFDELIQEGAIGLARAVDKYDLDRGASFCVHAYYWIKESMMRAISNRSREVRLPQWICDRALTLKKHYAIFSREHGRSPSTEEMAIAASMTIKEVEKVLRAIRIASPISYDIVPGDGDDSLANIFAVDRDSDPMKAAITADVIDFVDRSINCIKSDRNKGVMRSYLFSEDKAQYHRVGAENGLSREGARRIVSQQRVILKQLAIAANIR